MSDPVVSTAWLGERLGSPDVAVVDATWFMPAENRSGRAEFEAAHIPGAVFFDIDAVADTTVNLPHMLPTPQAFAEAAGALGLSPELQVVVYDAHGLFSAPRAWWTLRAMGFAHVRVLDGGLPRWRSEGRPLEAGPPAPRPRAFSALPDSGLVRSLEEVRAILDDGSAQLVDARPAARFRGEAPEPRPGLRGGHMPGACNLPFGAVVGPDGGLKPAAELRGVFEAAGVDLSRPIVTTCGSGVTASVLALALARLGLDRVPVYDGSWSEWGAHPDAPVVTGA